MLLKGSPRIQVYPLMLESSGRDLLGVSCPFYGSDLVGRVNRPFQCTLYVNFCPWDIPLLNTQRHARKNTTNPEQTVQPLYGTHHSLK